MTSREKPQPRYVAPADAARILGVEKSTFYRHVYPAVMSGAIQSIKIGSCRRISVDSLLAWADRQHGR